MDGDGRAHAPGPGRAKRLALAALTLVAAVALAGCTGGGNPPSLEAAAHWDDWNDEEHPHLFLNVTNTGDFETEVGEYAEMPRVTGPEGDIHVIWGADVPHVTVPAGESATVVLHAYELDNGHVGLAVAHGQGVDVAPPSGDYLVCIMASCTHASL